MLEFIVPFTDKAAVEKFDRCHGTNGEIVRCKDCRWGIPTKNGNGENIVICENPDSPAIEQIAIMPDWFCADGERRDEDEAD